MSGTAQKLLEEALRLSEGERAAVAGALIESLHGDAEPGVQEAWNAEITRRVAELDSGTVRSVSDAEARAAIFGDES